MKETVKTSRTAGYLEKIFRTLNEHYFHSEIEEPIITIQSTPRAYGHVTVSKTWRKGNGDHRRELNIDAGTLDRPIENVVATLLHEMVHLLNLHIDYDPRIGWSVTSPTEALMDFIISAGWDDIRMGRTDSTFFRTPGSGMTTPPNAPKKSSTRKYICPRCKMSVRATREVNILCGDCMVKMITG